MACVCLDSAVACGSSSYPPERWPDRSVATKGAKVIDFACFRLKTESDFHDEFRCPLPKTMRHLPPFCMSLIGALLGRLTKASLHRKKGGPGRRAAFSLVWPGWRIGGGCAPARSGELKCTLETRKLRV